jgi:hypothetical protein
MYEMVSKGICRLLYPCSWPLFVDIISMTMTPID